MFLKVFFEQRIESRVFFVIENMCDFSWVVQRLKDYKLLGP